MTGRARRSSSQRILETLYLPLARLLDALYRSAYNPLYRSGTLAIGMLLVLFVTGLYLVFFYSVGQPYESIHRIQDQVFLGRWIRAMHRYATDLAIVAVAFHVIQMMIQGRTWGPRVLAWISGVILLFALLLSTWTGYVMVWDSHGHWLSTAGAEMVAVVPGLRHQIMRTFSGVEPLTGSFFFMNLFLHVAIPLVMIAGIWIHTARLRQARWLPARGVFVSLVVVMFVVSVLMPAPMLPEADLQELPGRMPVDLFSGFWLPLMGRWGAVSVLGCMLFVFGGLFFVPWLWRVRRKDGRSTVNTDACKGCMQCYKDCPFESIDMVKRDDGTRRQYAMVDPAKCVSCGLCAGSCDDFNVGPPGLGGDEQIEQVERYLASLGNDQRELCLVYCKTNPGMEAIASRIMRAHKSVSAYSVPCVGSIHAFGIERLLQDVGSVLVLSCPEENCENRHGHALAVGRLLGRSGPHLSSAVDLSRVRVVSASGAEFRLVDGQVRELVSASNGTSSETGGSRSASWVTFIRTSFAHAILLLGVALMSVQEVGGVPSIGGFRVVLDLPGYEVLSRRDWTQEELAQSSSHMRLPQKVEKISLAYSLVLKVDGEDVFSDDLVPRRDGQLVRFVHEHSLDPGEHSVQVILVTNGEKTTLYDEAVVTDAGRVELFSFDGRKNEALTVKD